ncbi:MAG: hypothetical protein LBF59_03600 [Prevotellaceae bacterium]|nr:hypothetical protein [Prevotellaceae bacterium]
MTTTPVYAGRGVSHTPSLLGCNKGVRNSGNAITPFQGYGERRSFRRALPALPYAVDNKAFSLRKHSGTPERTLQSFFAKF